MKINIFKLDYTIYIFPTIKILHSYRKRIYSISFVWFNFAIHISF